jgi:DNA polymerase-3 subunit delta
MKSIFLFFGNDEVLMSERISGLKSKLASGAELSVENVELNKLEDLENFYSRGSNLSLFPQNSLLSITLTSKLLKSIEKEPESFSSLIKSISTTKKVLITLFADKADKNLKKLLLSSAVFEPLKNDLEVEEFIKLRSWQVEEIKERILASAELHNLKFQPSALNLFVDFFKENLDMITPELSKLSVYLLPENLITEKVVKDLYMPSSSVEDLYDLLLGISQKSPSLVLSDLSKSGTVIYNFAVLQNKLREAMKIKCLLEDNMDIYQISKQVGIHSYRVQLEVKKLSKVKSETLKQLVLTLSELEQKLKTGSLKEANALDVLLFTASCR